MAINKQNNRHTTPPQTHMTFIMPRPKGIGSCHKSGTGNNQGRQRTTHHDNRCFNHKGSHSKSNNLSSPLIPVLHPLNNSVIKPHQLYSVRKQSSRYSQNTPRDNRCFNSKDINSNSNYLSSLVIPVPTPLNYSVINPTQLSSVCQHSSISSQKTTPESQYSSVPGRTSPDPSNTMPPTSNNNGSHNIYGCMVDVSKLTSAQLQQHYVMLLQHYHGLCDTNDP